jgi:hypothetical protein
MGVRLPGCFADGFDPIRAMNIETLLLFLSVYGSQVDDIQPAWPSFFQPHGQFTAFRFQNLTEPQPPGATYEWITQGETWQGYELRLDTMRTWQSCEGAFSMTLRVTTPQRVVFERTECVWVVWSYYDFPECDDGCTIAEAGWVLHPDYEPWQYRVELGFDTDGDGWITANDLLNLLSE